MNQVEQMNIVEQLIKELKLNFRIEKFKMVELIKEIQELGNESNPDIMLMMSKLMALASLVHKGGEIPDEVFTSMNNDMRLIALSGFITMSVNGLEQA